MQILTRNSSTTFFFISNYNLKYKTFTNVISPIQLIWPWKSLPWCLQYVIGHEISFDSFVIYCICTKHIYDGLNYSLCLLWASQNLFPLWPAQFYYKKLHKFAFMQHTTMFWSVTSLNHLETHVVKPFFTILTCHASCLEANNT